jgi:hypothetical protein
MGLTIKTQAQWTSDNTVLSLNDIGVESDTGHYKIGDGATAWNSFAYYGIYSYSQLQLILLQNGVELQSAGSGSLFLAADGTYKSVSGGGVSVVSGTTIFNFSDESNSITNTISSLLITKTNLNGLLITPIETTETSLDDFTLNGLTFNVENIVDNVSFDIRASAVNNASGNYTVTYKLIY